MITIKQINSYISSFQWTLMERGSILNDKAWGCEGGLDDFFFAKLQRGLQ